jgi:hypothetical protein
LLAYLRESEMADIIHEIVDSCAIFTAVSACGRVWMLQNHHESTLRYDLNGDLERAKAERFLERAKEADLDVSPSH